MGKRNRCSAEQFVQIWQSSDTKKDAIKRTGYSKGTVERKAGILRKMGVPLKKFKAGRPLGEKWVSGEDMGRIAGLKALASHYNNGE